MTTAAYRKIHLQEMRVLLVMKTLKVEGSIHVEPNVGRFSDTWDSFLRMHDRHRFFPVTDTTVTPYHSDEPVASAPFMVVDRDEVIGVFPIEKG